MVKEIQLSDEVFDKIVSEIKDVSSWESTIKRMIETLTKLRQENHERIWGEVIPAMVPEYLEYKGDKYITSLDTKTKRLIVSKAEESVWGEMAKLFS